MYSHRAPFLSAAVLLLALLLSACGGGSVYVGIGDGDGGNDPPRPRPNPYPNPPTLSCSPAGLAASAQSTWPTVCMLTSSGEMVFELYDRPYAPLSVANFLRYVADGYYSNTLIHRVERDFVVQGGGYTSGQVPRPTAYAPIALESNNGLSNLRGTIAMARRSEPNSATSQFFVNVLDNSRALDYQSAAQPGYAVFGRLISGWNTLDAINELPVYVYSDTDRRPRTEVLVYWVQRLK